MSGKLKVKSLAATLSILALTIFGAAGICAQPADAAENLRLREGLSYVHDLDKGFPILADKMDDVKLEQGKATLLFFGAAGDLNTNRQAKRVVELYKKYKDQLKFIIVDVDHVTAADSKQLIKNYYQGYIPQEVILDKQGKTFWTHIGEIDGSALAAQLDKSLQ
jgi:hypothetical protein